MSSKLSRLSRLEDQVKSTRFSSFDPVSVSCRYAIFPRKKRTSFKSVSDSFFLVDSN